MTEGHIGDADAALIAGFLEGHANSHRQIDRWIHEVLSYRRSSLGAELEDVGQEARRRLLLVFREGRFAGQASLRTFVWRVTQRAAIDHMRARTRRAPPVGLDDAPEPVAPAAGPYDELEHAERRLIARRVLEGLDEDCRRLWSLAIYEELPYRVIAERMGLTEGTVKVRALRCRRKAVEIFERLVTAAATRRLFPKSEETR